MFQTVRGAFDVLPPGAASGDIPSSDAWRWAEGVVHDTMARFGMDEIRTPILEPLALVARGVGATTDIVQKEMFVVERGDDRFVLRPEVTAPVMRAHLQHRLDQRGGVQKLYYVAPCFRAERPQKGRYRQFHQFGIELLGSAAPDADLEAIANAAAVYDAFGITATRLRLNTLGDAADRPAFRDALREHLAPDADALSETSRRRLDQNPLRILDTKSEHERALLEGAPRLGDFVGDDARRHHDAVREGLTRLGIAFVEDDTLVRGLDYYTRTVFELESDALGAQGALAAGGRYDGLAQAVGAKQAVPAVGYAAGFERLFIALGPEALPEPPALDAFLVAMDDAARSWAAAAASELRSAGFRVDRDLAGRAWRKQLKEAARRGARHAVVVGPDDLAAGTASVKHLASGDEQTVPLGDLAGALAR